LRNGKRIESNCPGEEIGERQAKKNDGASPSRHHPAIRVYPNPAKEYITIESTSSFEVGGVTLFNLQGQRLIQQFLPVASTSFLLPISDLTAGIYLLEVRLSHLGVERHKILILR
jgi:hypothetical protein